MPLPAIPVQHMVVLTTTMATTTDTTETVITEEAYRTGAVQNKANGERTAIVIVTIIAIDQDGMPDITNAAETITILTATIGRETMMAAGQLGADI